MPNEREADVLRAAERLVVLARQGLDTGCEVPREATARCLRAYDEAKQRAHAPTGFDHVLDETALQSIPEREATPPGVERVDSFAMPVVEPETLFLMRALSEWERVLVEAKRALEASQKEHAATDPDPNAPCPHNLMLAYKRVFRSQDATRKLTTLIEQTLEGYVLRRGEMAAWILRFDGSFTSAENWVREE